MRIDHLLLENFKRHGALQIDLVPGLNVIRGPNESGKTTIQRALEMVLFRRPTSSSQDLDEARSWTGGAAAQPGNGAAPPVVEIGFDDDGTKGTLRKTFAGQKGTVELRVGEDTLTDPAAVEREVVRLTGLPSEKFFRATASIRHQELGGLNEDEGTLRDRLQQSMSGADRGTHAARKKLEEAIRRYRTEGAKNPGYMKVLRAEADRLREAVRGGDAGLAQLEADRRALAEATSRRATLDTQLAGQREGVERSERATALAVKATDAAQRYARYRRAADLRGDIAVLESRASVVSLADLRSAIDYLRNLEFKISEMRAELATEPDLSTYDVAIPSPRWRLWAVLGGLLAVGAAIAIIAGAAFGAGQAAIAVGGALAVVGLIALLAGFRRYRAVNDVRLQNELRDAEIARRLAGRTDLAERVRQAEVERDARLASIGLTDLASAEAWLTAETERIAQMGTLVAEYRGLIGHDPADEDVTTLRDEAAAEANESRHALAGMGDIGRDPERFLAAFRAAVQRLTPEREAALHAESQADARLAANDIDAEKVAVDAEALAAAEEGLATAERRLRIYEDVLATLDRAEQATMKKAARFLEQRMARDIERVTDGRYRRLKVDESTLSFSVFSAEMNDWIDARQLSQGTLDQLYLCARLGIVRQVTQPADPPLVLDDPFISFDDERARAAMALLKDIAHENQVIYLTTSDRYDAEADKVIVLPTPGARDEPQPLAAAEGPVETISVWENALLQTLKKTRPDDGRDRAAAGRPASPSSPGTAAPAEPSPLWPEER